MGLLAMGAQSASAITLTIPGLTNALEKACDPKVPVSCSLSFNYFDDPSTWLSITNATGGIEKWAVKGTVIAATANLSDSVTGQGLGAKVFTLTAAEFAYREGTATTSRLSGLTFSNFFDFTTTTRSGTVLFSNPTFLHRLSGKLLTNSSGLNNNDRVQSVVSFNGTGSTISATDLVSNAPESLTNDLVTDSWQSSGRPFGTTFNFADAKDENLSSSPYYLKQGTITSNLINVTLAKGDTLSLPASDCVIVAQRELVKTPVVTGKGKTRMEVTGVRIVDGNDEAIVTKERASGPRGYTFPITEDRAEELCTKVARSVPSEVPEPSSALPVLGGLFLWGAGRLIRQGRSGHANKGIF